MGEGRNPLTWEGKPILDLPHGAVGGPHGSEGSGALRDVVLSGTQLLLGEELALTDLLRYFKTNSVPLGPYAVLGEAARRRASSLRAHTGIHLHKHIHTRPKNEWPEPARPVPRCGATSYLWHLRQRTSPLSPFHQMENRATTNLTDVTRGLRKGMRRIRKPLASRRYSIHVPFLPTWPRT